MKYIFATAFLTAICAPAIAGEYDFSYSNLEHLKGAYQMCETTGFNGDQPDCPQVYSKCWSAQNIYRSGHRYKTKCKKASSFTSTQADADKSINDAKGMMGGQ